MLKSSQSYSPFAAGSQLEESLSVLSFCCARLNLCSARHPLPPSSFQYRHASYSRSQSGGPSHRTEPVHQSSFASSNLLFPYLRMLNFFYSLFIRNAPPPIVMSPTPSPLLSILTLHCSRY